MPMPARLACFADVSQRVGAGRVEDSMFLKLVSELVLRAKQVEDCFIPPKQEAGSLPLPPMIMKLVCMPQSLHLLHQESV